MTRTQKIALGAVAAVLLGTGAVWLFILRDTSPPPLSLEDAVAGLSTTQAPVTTAAGTGSPEPAATDAPIDPPATQAPGSAAPATQPPATTAEQVSLGGTWSLDPAGSIVGYRIEEELAGIGGNTAVGRTSELVGSVSFDGTTIEAVDVTVDMTTLRSDRSQRDNQLRTRGLQTSQFPEATFVLDEPIRLGSVPAVGAVITATANGTLTLHGVSRQVGVSVEAQLTDSSTIVVVGGTEVALADYEIDPPTGFSVLSIADSGLFEFQLTFRAG